MNSRLDKYREHAECFVSIPDTRWDEPYVGHWTYSILSKEGLAGDWKYVFDLMILASQELDSE